LPRSRIAEQRHTSGVMPVLALTLRIKLD